MASYRGDFDKIEVLMDSGPELAFAGAGVLQRYCLTRRNDFSVSLDWRVF